MSVRSLLLPLVLLPLAALGLSQGEWKPDAGEAAKIAYVKSGLASFVAALESFRRDCGRYPTTAEGLAALSKPFPGLEGRWHGPYVGGFTTDAWARPYWYAATPKGFALASFGADGKPGGRGADEDLALTN